METLYIVMPAYNEEENIKTVIEMWYPLLDGKSKNSRLVVADSGSTDNTHAILLKMKKDYPKLDILLTTEKQHGPKVIALFDYAIKKKADYVFQTDSDGQTNPNEFCIFWEQRKEYQGLFGNRMKRGDGISRIFVEKVVCVFCKYFLEKIPEHFWKKFQSIFGENSFSKMEKVPAVFEWIFNRLKTADILY